MKIAVTHENGQVFGHFGHTAQFKIYEVENNEIVSSAVVDTNGAGHGALADFLADHGVEVLICGGIGGGARMALDAEDIRIFGGVTGGCDAAVAALLSDKLAFDPEAKCSHHDHDHGHSCGGHDHHGHDHCHHDHDHDHHCGDHGCGHHH